MKTGFYTIFFLLASMFATNLKAQTDVIFSNSRMNADVFNPALIEDNEKINLRFMVRRQWVGFPDAPEAEQLSIAAFFTDLNMGLKFSLVNQSLGKEVLQRMNLSYAYRIYFAENISLNMGLSAGMYQRGMLFSKLIFQDRTEPLQRPNENYLRPDFEFGLHLAAKGFAAGYAANHITTKTRDASIAYIPLHQHFYADYSFSLSPEFILRTGGSVHHQGAVTYFQADAQLISEIIQAGIGWRHKDAFIIKAGLTVTENLSIDYSYDMGINTFATYNSGSHEFSIRLKFNKSSKTYLSPRFMD